MNRWIYTLLNNPFSGLLLSPPPLDLPSSAAVPLDNRGILFGRNQDGGNIPPRPHQPHPCTMAQNSQVLGHSLIRLLVCSHRSLICLLCPCACTPLHSFAHSLHYTHSFARSLAHSRARGKVNE